MLGLCPHVHNYRWLSLRPGCRVDSVGHWELCPMLQIPASHPQNLPIWPQTKDGANLPSVSSSCCSQEASGSGFCFGRLRGQKRPLTRGSELCCAVQLACAFSCFVLKYPLVSFFTSYSLYPKLCISPLNGVIFLIAGRALLLDTSLLLVHCMALQRAP